MEWFNALPGAERMLAAVERAFNFNVEVIKTANAAVANGKLFYVHVDHLGTPQALTNEAGAVNQWGQTRLIDNKRNRWGQTRLIDNMSKRSPDGMK